MSADADPDEAVPKLPRGRGLKFSGPEVFRILLTLMTLVGVVLLARPCANAVSGFVMGMDGSGSAAKAMPKPGNVDQPQQYEQLKPDMTEAELKAAIERAKARNAESDHSEAGRAGNAGSGGAGVGSAASVGSGSASGSASPSRP